MIAQRGWERLEIVDTEAYSAILAKADISPMPLVPPTSTAGRKRRKEIIMIDCDSPEEPDDAARDGAGTQSASRARNDREGHLG